MNGKVFSVLIFVFGMASDWGAAYAAHIDHWSFTMLFLQGLYGTILGTLFMAITFSDHKP